MLNKRKSHETGPDTRQIPEFDLESWKKEMIGRIDAKLKTAERVVVSVAGASASGKGEATEQLRQALEGEGKRTLVVSTDNYYKGVSRNIMEKVVARLDLADADIDLEALIEFVQKIIIDKPFNEKFSEGNLQAIADYLKQKHENIDKDLLKHLISEEFARIDFDSPQAVNLADLSKDIDGLKKGEKVAVPDYSMKLSEPVEGKEYQGKDFDVILLEGIYALREEALAVADIKSFIEADPRTLLLRRFRRDILAGRSMFPPEIDLWIILEIVLPAYHRFIEPTKENSDLVLHNDYTGMENFDTQTYDVQEKLPLSDEEMQKLMQALGEPEEILQQEDLYFSTPEGSSQVEHLIRARAENGCLKSLTHKGSRVRRDDGKIIRPTEQYLQEDDFGTKYHNLDELREAFQKAGFVVMAEMIKERKIFRQGEIEAVIDSIKGLGNFIELRTNNKISRAEVIDRFIKKNKLEGKKPIGPYIDEYLSLLRFDPEAARQQEALLNMEISKETILANNLCQTLEKQAEIAEALEELRQGYPDKPPSGQCQGAEFRQAGKKVLDGLAQATLAGIEDASQAVVLMPWRSGLAFGESYKGLEVNQFYHLSSKRDEETLQTIVDYEQGEAGPDSVVIIADPMLATGNTIVDAIERMMDRGVQPENIIINAVISAPVGIAKIKKAYPQIRIIVGAVDDKLDHKGYIVPGLGDFGDKYFTDLNAHELQEIADSFGLEKVGQDKLIRRIKKQSVSEVLTALEERDLKDQEINDSNKEDLLGQGLEAKTPKRQIKVNTGIIEGVENVVSLIAREISEDTKVIAIDGVSGTGKSSTTEKLAQEIGALKFSMGEIFRFLAYCQKFNQDLEEAIKKLSFQLADGKLYLFSGETNVTTELAKDLRSPDLEQVVPETAARMQAQVIRFCSQQIETLAKTGDSKILFEGRAFTLDFLPCDLRVKLVADPSIRAERRWNQQFNK